MQISAAASAANTLSKPDTGDSFEVLQRLVRYQAGQFLTQLSDHLIEAIE